VTDLALLSVRGARKRFGPVLALDGVDIDIERGEIHALMGENGAGKSTLIRCVSGVHSPDAGSVSVAGVPARPRTPREAELFGISCVHQEVHLIPHLSVAENICLGREPTRRFPFPGIRWGAVRERARQAVERVGFEIDVRRELCTCSIAAQQLVAIARSLDCGARVVILDEPTSSLNEREVEALFSVLRRLRANGLGILLVTHFLDQVYRIADRITVLRDGRLVGTRSAADLSRAELVAMMVGRAIHREPRAEQHASRAEQPRFAARGLRRRGALDAVDCSVDRGEAVGLAGLLGSGRSETLRAIFGADPIDAGTMTLDGHPVRPGSPREAMRVGIAFLPEDRKRDGIIPSLSVRENIILALQARRGVFARVSNREALLLADRFIAALRIRTPSPETPVHRLSGGNQQKTLIARALATDPLLLLLDEPTRGIDIGAKEDVLDLVRSERERGVAIIMASSELEELVRACGRVVVLRDRRSVAELMGSAVDPTAIVRAIAEAAPEPDVEIATRG
jgi:monosaccharide-transporting ATPase